MMKHLRLSPLAGFILFIAAVAPDPAAARAQPCCGPITPQGRQLAALLDATGVDHLWLAGWHVDWKTGVIDRAEPGGREAKTHCSAFVAAVAYRLGIYVLRPPEHRQSLLANAQMGWLGREGSRFGWQPVAGAGEAQRLANAGMLVLAAFENPDRHRPGHIAVIRPSRKSAARLAAHGPQETQAGARNAVSTTTAKGFRHHRGAWEPGGTGAIRYYAHAVDWTRYSNGQAQRR
jgi:hypothetical protein